MFAPSIAFVDLETTGTIASDDRITEVGIVRVDEGMQVSEWSSSSTPVQHSARYSGADGNHQRDGCDGAHLAQIAEAIATQIAGCIFVAHNARFDYGFLKHEFDDSAARSRPRYCAR
jgi:DNA polymerase-3 subunit epsilon